MLYISYLSHVSQLSQSACISSLDGDCDEHELVLPGAKSSRASGPSMLGGAASSRLNGDEELCIEKGPLPRENDED